METVGTASAQESAASEQPSASPREMLEAAVRSPAFIPAAAVALGVGCYFWNLIRTLPTLWTSDDYYSHGFLVPLISGFVVYRWWPRLKAIPAKPGYLALIPLLLLFFPIRAAVVADIPQLLSICLLATALFGVWFIAGARWMWAVSLPVLYLAFAMPLWTGAIDNYTNPLQIMSTSVAYTMLKAMGFAAMRTDPTMVMLDNFTLNIAVPCSGLKLVLAVSAFTVFFILVARLKLWANGVMLAMILPLCLFINGLRIALVGIVGEFYGGSAAASFHDYSGYITLVICFIILFKLARGLGWKD